MIGIDTNVLVRYLAQDDPVQSPKATAFFERLTARNPGYVNLVALAETAWVLDRYYELPRAELAGALEALLQVDVIEVQKERAVFQALQIFKEGCAFADALIGALNHEAGCARTMTFDRRAARMAGFAQI